jgi:hypothetical protein
MPLALAEGGRHKPTERVRRDWRSRQRRLDELARRDYRMPRLIQPPYSPPYLPAGATKIAEWRVTGPNDRGSGAGDSIGSLDAADVYCTSDEGDNPASVVAPHRASFGRLPRAGSPHCRLTNMADNQSKFAASSAEVSDPVPICRSNSNPLQHPTRTPTNARMPP